MKIDTTVIVTAADIVRSTRKLKKELKEWYARLNREDIYEDWVCRRLEDMADAINAAEMDFMTKRDAAAALVKALEVNAIGVPLAVKVAKDAEKYGCANDICCYVEDGNVNVSVWFCFEGKAEKKKDMIDVVAQMFRDAGYSVEVVGNPDGEEFTVSAEMPFSAYYELLKKGGK